MSAGYRKVRPLAGGLDAWLAEGRDFETFGAELTDAARLGDGAMNEGKQKRRAR